MHSRGKKSERGDIAHDGAVAQHGREVVHEPVATPPKYRRSTRATKLTPYHEVLKLALKADAHRPKRERRTARALYTENQDRRYEGGYTRVTDFIASGAGRRARR